MKEFIIANEVDEQLDFGNYEDVGGLDGLGKLSLGKEFKGKFLKIATAISVSLAITLTPGMATETLADENPKEDVDTTEETGIESVKKLWAKLFYFTNDNYLKMMDPESSDKEKKKAETELLNLLQIARKHLIRYALISSDFEKKDPKARLSPGAKELVMMTMQSDLPKTLKKKFGYFIIQAENTKRQQQIAQNKQQIASSQQKIASNQQIIARNKKLSDEIETRMMKSLGESVMKELANRQG